jgi:16S rRNA processing protein RimM
MAEGIRIARIARAWGNKGEVTADLLTDFPERFDDVEAVTLRRGGQERAAELEGHWFHKGRVVLKFVGVDSISDAEPLAGCDVVVPEEELYELPEGEDVFYDFQLAGCAVVTTAGEAVGEVNGVVRTGGIDLLSVRRPGRDEALVPFVDEICVEVDVDDKRVVIDPPEGLLDL